jgi:hypothetical protein
VALISGGKWNRSAGTTATYMGRSRGKSVTAVAKNFGRKSKEERPPASPSAMGNRGGGGVPGLTEKNREEGGGVALIRGGGWGGAQNCLCERCRTALHSICQPRWTVALRFETDSKFKLNSN